MEQPQKARWREVSNWQVCAWQHSLCRRVERRWGGERRRRRRRRCAPGAHVRELDILDAATLLRVGRILQECGGRGLHGALDSLVLGQHAVGGRPLAIQLLVLHPLAEDWEVVRGLGGGHILGRSCALRLGLAPLVVPHVRARGQVVTPALVLHGGRVGRDRDPVRYGPPGQLADGVGRALLLLLSMPWATTLAVRKGAPHGGMANKLSETKQAPLSPQIPALSAERARRPGGSQAEEHSGEEELEAEAPSFVGAAYSAQVTDRCVGLWPSLRRNGHSDEREPPPFAATAPNTACAALVHVISIKSIRARRWSSSPARCSRC